MKVLVISGNPKKKGALASLTEEAARGAREGGADVEEIRLADMNIGYCKFCMHCHDDGEADIGQCVQDDDMKEILPKIKEADGFILACPVSSAQANALFKTFIERSIWRLARPTGRMLWVGGIPESRLKDKQRYAITVTTAGAVPTYLRAFCNGSTKQMLEIARIGFNAKVKGKIYAGLLNFRGLGKGYLDKSYRLGRKLADSV